MACRSVLWFLVCLCLVNGAVYYVTPTTNTSCPDEPCLTISEYAAQPHQYFNSTTIMVFQEGEHLLSQTFSLHDISELEFTVYRGSKVHLKCVLGDNFRFGNVQSVLIHGLWLFGCYGNRVEEVGKFVLDNSTFQGAAGNTSKTAIYLVDVEEVSISDSSFAFHDVGTAGCGVLSIDNCNVSILNSWFTDNSAGTGGVVCAFNGYLAVADSMFANNTAGLEGGVVYANQSTITAENSRFASNFANFGSVASITSLTTFSMDSCNFDDNWSSSDGGVMRVQLGSTVEANHSLFQNNSAENVAGVLQLTSESMAVLYNSTFVDNQALNGGVISSYGGTRLDLVNSNFYNNRADDYGATMNTDTNASISITGCRFVNNFANVSGGCAHFRNSHAHISDFNVFEGNRARYGGAFTVVLSSMHMNSDSDGSHACDYGSYLAQFLDNSAEHGGALNIIDHSVARVHCASFENNAATNRGGAILVRTSTQVNLTDTSFRENQAEEKGGTIFAQFASINYCDGSLIVDGNKGGSGVIYVTSCNVSVAGNSTFSNNQNSFLAHNSDVVFMGNAAFYGGTSNTTEESGAITAVRSTIAFRGNLLLEGNSGVYGGAVTAIESTIFNHDHASCTFRKNSAVNGGAVYAYKSELLFHGDVNFHDNEAKENGGGLSAVGSRAQFYTHSSFTENNASSGGAVYLDQTSSLAVVKEMMECPGPREEWYCTNRSEQWTKLAFIRNSAEWGGAIYKNDSGDTTCNSKSLDQNPGCFIQTIAAYESANDWEPADINFANIDFVDNSASSGGALLYGGLLDRCAVDRFAELKNVAELGKNYSNIPDTFTYFCKLVSTNFSTSEISSDPVRICFCENGLTNCELPPPVLHVNRGEQFPLSLAVVTQTNASVAVDVDVSAYLSVGRLESVQYKQRVSGCSTLSYNVYSAGPETLHLYPEGPCANNGISRVEVSININEGCPVGFSLSNSSLECVCDPDIRYITNCSIDSESVVREGNYWISSVSGENSTSIIAHEYCPYDYCYPSTDKVLVDLNKENGSDSQCAFHRSGRLCGSCQDGYSLTLGSSKCEQCSNYWLFLILPFGLVGVGLVVLMMACNLTLAAGTINGVLFYANILVANRATFFPYQEQNILTIFVSWLGLNLGIATCFYDGMDGFGKTWVQISFEVYLIVLVFVVIALGRNTKVSAFFHHYKLNPVHTLATLVMLSYEKLSRRIFSLLAFTHIKYPDGNIQVWLFDPNLLYMEGKFISLAIVAVFIIIAGIALNFLLLFSKVVVAKSKFASVNNFLEAFYAPFKTSHKYWPGLLLFVQNISSFMSEFANAGGNPNYNLHFIFVLLIAILTLKLFYVYASGISLRSLRGHARLDYGEIPTLRDNIDPSPDGVQKSRKGNGIIYNSSALDLLETSFVVNLSLLTYFTMYFRDEQGNQRFIFYISASVVFASFIGIILYHFCVYTPFSIVVKKLTCKCPTRDQKTVDTEFESYGSTRPPSSSVLTASFSMH